MYYMGYPLTITDDPVHASPGDDHFRAAHT